jgi:hypothetical protein
VISSKVSAGRGLRHGRSVLGAESSSVSGVALPDVGVIEFDAGLTHASAVRDLAVRHVDPAVRRHRLEQPAIVGDE